MLVLNIFQPVIDWANHALHGLLLLLDAVVYWAASACYQLFIKLATARIFDDSFFANFSNRIYAILGVFMLFYLAYSLLNALIDPEKLSKGDKGVSKIATNLIVSLVILGLLPSIFSYVYRLQNYILSSNLIGSIVLGTSVIDVNSDDPQQEAMLSFGDVISFTVLNTFLNPENTNVQLADNYSWFDLKKDILDDSDYLSLPSMNKAVSTGVPQVNSSGGTQDDVVISYRPIISTVTGAFLVYVMLSFTLDLGVRVFKFAFLQLVAPIPVIMRVVPGKKSVFDKWLKLTLSVYFEVFIRVATMYIAIYFINALTIQNAAGSSIIQDFLINGGLLGKVAFVILILGLFTFAKQVPKMISDTLGLDTGNMKLGILDKVKAGGVFGAAVSGAIGFATGGLGGAAASLVNGAGLAGAGIGALNGWKNKGLQFGKQRKDVYQTITGDYKHDPSLFGGATYTSELRDQAKTYLKDTSKENRNQIINSFENDIIAREEETRKANYQQAVSAYQHQKEAFATQKQADIQVAEANIVSGRSTFEEDKQKRIQEQVNEIQKNETLYKQLEVDRDMAYQERDYGLAENITKEMSRIDLLNNKAGQTIASINQETFENSEVGKSLLNKLQEAKSREYSNPGLEAQIAELSKTIDDSTRRSEIADYYKKAETNILDHSEKIYKAQRDIARKLGEAEQRVRNQTAIKDAFKALGITAEDLEKKKK